MATDIVGNRTLKNLIAERAALYGDKVFAVFESESGEQTTLTFEELEQETTRAADAFIGMGVAHGDAVVVHMRNSREFVIAWLGLAKAGAIMVPTNLALTAQEIAFEVEKSRAIGAVTTDDHWDKFASLGLAHNIVVDGEGDVSWDRWIATGDPRAELPRFPPETPMQILFTSGSSGKPKGVVITHSMALWLGERMGRNFGQRDDDCTLCVMPLFHVNSQGNLLAALNFGGSVAIVERFSAGQWLDQLIRHGATLTSLIGTLVRILLEQPPSDRDQGHKLRASAMAINPPDEVWHRFEERYGIRLVNGYGMTEVYSEVLFSPMFGDRRVPALGLPTMDRRVKVVRPDGSEADVGEVGEICVWGIPGRTMFLEYFEDPEATAAVVKDGWFHTGDNAYVDEDGYFWWVDRKKDTIKRGGENVSASEVENRVTTHEAIQAAAAVAIPDEIRDEAILLFVQPVEGETITEDEVLEYCRQHLAKFKVPSRVELRDRLPTTSVGKIDKHTLRAEAATIVAPAAG
jgi:crotonobetaine/carnitine-CoA ligase